MRQVGILAAAGIIALTDMVERLREDHERAKKLALAIHMLPGIELDPEDVQTNMINFGFNYPKMTRFAFLEELRKRKILAFASSEGIRFVTHKEVDDEDVEKAINAFKSILMY